MSKVLSKDELNKNMDLLSNSWSVEGLYLKGSYSFNNFDNAFSFMKEVAVKCEEMNHHPKWTNVYNKLDIELYTHDLGGITEKDFELFDFIEGSIKYYDKAKFNPSFHLLFLMQLSKFLGFYPETENSEYKYFDLQQGCYTNTKDSNYTIYDDELNCFNMILVIRSK